MSGISPENRNIGQDGLGRPAPIGERETAIWASTRLLLMSRRAAREGDYAQAYDLTDQVELMGMTFVDKEDIELGYRLIERASLYTELNILTQQKQDTPENIANVYREYGYVSLQ